MSKWKAWTASSCINTLYNNVLGEKKNNMFGRRKVALFFHKERNLTRYLCTKSLVSWRSIVLQHFSIHNWYVYIIDIFTQNGRCYSGCYFSYLRLLTPQFSLLEGNRNAHIPWVRQIIDYSQKGYIYSTHSAKMYVEIYIQTSRHTVSTYAYSS